MLRYRFTDTDLGDIRFGVSPLCEMGLSLRTLREPARYPLQLPWLLRTQEARASLDLEVLLALVDERLWTPDFLNPRPDSPLTVIDDELQTLAAMSPSLFVAQIEAIHGALPAPFGQTPRRALARTVAALSAYWTATFEPWWPRMRSILQADIVHRGRRIAESGLAAMLGEIAENVSFADNVLTVRPTDPRDRSIDVAGRGFTLVPTMFSRRVSSAVDDDEPPLLLYAARGRGALWETEKPATVEAVAALLGETRAALLVALESPASSTELGVRFDVTTSAVNQHLRALHAGGLVTATRYGRSVLYLRSELGQALLAR